jgi:Calx-beta domain/PQQ-like domain
VVYANGTDWPGILAGAPPNRGILSAVAADGSHELWHVDTPLSPNISGVAVANGVVYFQSGLDVSLYALDAGTGHILARVPTGSLSSGPAISRGQIYVGTGDAVFPTFDPTLPIGTGSIVAVGLSDPAPAVGAIRSRVSAARPQVSIADATATPSGNGWVSLTFEVRLSAPSDRPVTVRYHTADGTARAGHDYRRAIGVVRFAPGETVKTVTVRVRADLVSGDAETFNVKLRRPTNALMGDAAGVGTIRRMG